MSIIKYKDGDQWASILTVKGDQGEPGPPGEPGPQGPAGPPGPAGAVNDVTINGTSIVGAGGVAEVPLADASTYGAVKANSIYGIGQNQVGLYVAAATEADINSRTQGNRPIVPTRLDYAVKAALCDGQGAAYTASEQAAAQARLGTSGGGGSDLSFHDYDTVTYAAITADLAANKLPIIKRLNHPSQGDIWYAYTRTSDNVHYFTCATDAYVQLRLSIDSNNVKSAGSYYPENADNKLSSTATWVSNDSKYPTTAAGDARWDQIYWVTYGTTTAAQIQAAIDAGKFPVCDYEYSSGALSRFTLSNDTPTLYRFTAQTYTGTMLEITCNKSTSAWNKTALSITKSTDTWNSSDQKWPSAAACDARFELKGQGGGGAVVREYRTTYAEMADLVTNETPFTAWASNGAQLTYAGTYDGAYVFWGWYPNNVTSMSDGIPVWSALDSSCFYWCGLRDDDENPWFAGWDPSIY